MSTAAATAELKRPIEHYELDWRGIQVRVTYDPDAFGAAGEIHHYSHLQISNARHRQPLPMSETGYKSHHRLCSPLMLKRSDTRPEDSARA